MSNRLVSIAYFIENLMAAYAEGIVKAVSSGSSEIGTLDLASRAGSNGVVVVKLSGVFPHLSTHVSLEDLLEWKSQTRKKLNTLWQGQLPLIQEYFEIDEILMIFEAVTNGLLLAWEKGRFGSTAIKNEWRENRVLVVVAGTVAERFYLHPIVNIAAV